MDFGWEQVSHRQSKPEQKSTTGYCERLGAGQQASLAGGLFINFKNESAE